MAKEKTRPANTVRKSFFSNSAAFQSVNQKPAAFYEHRLKLGEQDQQQNQIYEKEYCSDETKSFRGFKPNQPLFRNVTYYRLLIFLNETTQQCCFILLLQISNSSAARN